MGAQGDPSHVRDTAAFRSPARDWVIQTKLAPPKTAFAVIPREELAARTARATQVTIVSAPAGFGKTTFMTQLWERLGAAGMVTAWLSADELDRDGKDLLSYLVVSCLAAGSDLGPLAQMADSHFSGAQAQALCALLINGLLEDGRPTVLFLDDYHRIDNDQVAPLMRLLIAKAPDTVKFVIGSRSTPDLGLAALRARGKLQELSLNELRFSAGEIRHFFDGHGLRPDVAEIQRKTEGWAVALQLALPFLQQHVGADALARFSGRTEEIADFLLEEVLLELPAEEQQFLTLTSLLERVNGDLANAVTGRSDGWEMLERHHRRGLPLSPLDNEHSWFRYHHLLADLLREKLSRRGAETVQEVHRRAATWLASQGFLAEAMSHALRVREPDFAPGVLEARGGWRLFLCAGVAGLRAFGALPAVAPEVFPLTALAQALLAAVEGDVAAARKTFEMIRTALAGAGRLAEFAADLSNLDFTLHCYEDRPFLPDKIAAAVRTWSLPGTAPDMRAVGENLNVIALVMRGDGVEAIARGAGLLERNRALEATYAELYLAIYEGLARIRLGELQSARELFSYIVRRGRARYGDTSNHAANAEIFLAWLNTLFGDDAAADALLGDKLQTIEYAEGTCDIVITAFDAALRLGRRTSTVGLQENLIERAEMMGRLRNWPRLGARAGVWRVREHTLAGRFAAARNALAGPSWPRGAQLQETWDVRVEANLALGLLEYEEGRPASVLTRIAAVEAELQERDWRLWLPSCLLLRAGALRDLGDRTGAERAFVASWKSAAPGTFPHLIESLPRRLQVAALAVASPEARDQIGRRPRRTGAAEHAGNGSPVTEREAEILCAMADGLSNKEMALKLEISESTVKFHRKNLYRKLDVSTRSRAISAARGLGLIGGPGKT